MPRHPRILSSTGIYHVMMRGINKEDLFIDDKDRERFLEIIQIAGSFGEYDIYAYCLMSNHVHLLLKETGDPIDRIMKRIGISYSQYFNNRYERIGHVFQDRYRSETVENERYLLGCIRYIHNNPVKAGMVRKPEHYAWSSYHDYVEGGKYARGIANTRFVLTIFSDDLKLAVQAFREFSEQEDEKHEFMDYDYADKNAEQEALYSRINSIIIKHGLSIEELAECKDRKKRDMILRELKSINGLSVRRLAEIVSIGRSIIYNA